MDDGDGSYENIKLKDLRLILVHFGFDFSLMGSIYIYEILKEATENSSLLNGACLPTITKLAEKHNIKMKTLSRDVRWAIKKAYEEGLLKYVPFFQGRTRVPNTRQVLSWLYHFYMFHI